MKKLRLKKGAIIGAYLIAFSLTGMSAFYVSQNMQANNPTEEDIEYVNSSIIDDDEKDREVIKEDVKMVKPYTDDNVQVLKYFYDYQANADSQEKSILYHENTYIQNSGMDFGLENTFDVVSVKKNDTVKQGQVIGKSGTNTIDQDLGNHLHFELYKSGEVVDPSKYFDQVISDTTEKSTSDNTTTEDTSDNSNTNEETE